MAGHFRSTMCSAAFPDRPQFSEFMKPCRFEGEIQNLEVRGEIPQEIDGTFYRVMPDPQLPPFIEDDPWFNGDGNISAFRIKDGCCHFKQRYVRTEKFLCERAAKRALGGKYRNKYTDAVEFKIRTTANTNIVYFNGRLLACKEDAPPYAMDPETLETIGLEDFDGQLPSLTFTAHPKLDPDTGELLCFGYEAKGDGTPDICYFSVDASGRFTETVWLISPIVAMIHDFAITKNWILFPVIPQTCDIVRMKKGGEHWQWDPNVPFYLGVLPRRGASSSDVKWFRAPNSFPGHTVNAFEDANGNISFDLPLSDKNVFFWWPDAHGNAPVPEEISAHLVRITFDPQSDNLDLPPHEVIMAEDCEFPRIDDRVHGKEHAHAFFDLMDPSLGTDFATIMPRMGGGHPPYNSLGHLHYESNMVTKYFPGPTHLVQEPIFIQRKGTITAEGDGFVVVLVNNYASMSSELHIVDTRDFSKAQADPTRSRQFSSWTEMHPQPDCEDLIHYFQKDPAFTLHTAVVLGDLSRIRELLDSGRDIDKLADRYPDHSGTPLHVAIWCDQSAAFEFFFIRGADINILDDGGHFRPEDTPIRLATRLGRRDMFKRLWNEGAERNKYTFPSARNMSLIEVAAYEGSAHILEDLIAWDDSWTRDERVKALLLACRPWHVDAVATLLFRCQFSKTGLELAMNAAATGTGREEYERFIPVEEKLRMLEEYALRQAGVLILLLDEYAHVAGVNDVFEIMNSLLPLVSSSPENIAALKLLLKRGGNPNIQRAPSGVTPLHLALGWRSDLKR
ncbi:hypothetical protein SLS60_010024 [Paraconiothyrium brasiliense]|uniref:Uncharacterized protein n=1 Tax=Paraconiothyrium brasiliense TaxID=300254 RepID=A0ABR3QTD7_9PLEO